MTLIKGCLGYLSSYAAKNRIKDINTAILKFKNNTYFFYRDYFKRKVELKMKQYNIESEEPEKEE